MHARKTEQPRSAWRQRSVLSQAVGLGMNMAVGMAAFSLLGYYLDRRRGGGVFWTLCGMGLGLVYGGYEVWKIVRDLNAQGGRGAENSAPGQREADEPEPR